MLRRKRNRILKGKENAAGNTLVSKKTWAVGCANTDVANGEPLLPD